MGQLLGRYAIQTGWLLRKETKWGTCVGKNRELNGDAEYMMQRDCKNVKYLDRRKDKFGFNEKITTEPCSKLVKDIEKVGQKDRKLNDKNGLT